MTDDRIRLRFVAPLRSRTPSRTLKGNIAFLPMDAIGEDGQYDYESVRPAVDVADGGYTYFEQGDVVRARVTPCFENGKGALLSRLVGGCGLGTTELFVFRPSRHIDPRFLYYVTASVEFTGHGAATIYGAHGVRRVDDQFARDFRIWLPSLQTQRGIADYLDRETTRIDALIAVKQRIVELLGEKRSELATNLLLGPPVAGRSAGPGQVAVRPGLTLVPFRWLFREIDVRSATGSETLLSVSQTRGVIPQSELGDRHQHAESLVGYKVCMAGDLVVNRMWVYYGALGSASQSGLVSPDYAVFRPTAAMSSDFAAYVLRTPAYVGEMTRLVKGIGAAFQGAVRKPRLHPSELGLIEMPVVPVSEQKAVLRILNQQSEAISRRVSLVERSRTLLEERRRALITAAVTGQLDIPEAA